MSDSPASPRVGGLRERTAEEIRVMLARRRMSGSELARRTGMKQPYLSRRLTAEIPFDLDDLEVIARELGVTVAELLGENGQDAQTTARYRAPVRYWPDDAEELIPHQPNGQHGAIVPTPATRRPARMLNGARREARVIGSQVVPA